MGASSSKPPPLPADAWPSYYLKDASLTPEIIERVRKSWRKCMEGTEAHKAARKLKTNTLSTTNTTGGNARTVGTGDNGPRTSGAGGEGEDEDSGSYSPIVYFYDTFYNHLFEIAPSVRPLFRESMKVQGRALVKMIDVAVSMVDDLPKLVPALQDLAKRHVKYGARVPHYAVVGEALLYALKTCLGEEQATSEVMHAWLTVYSVMISVILPTAWEEEHRLKRVAEEEKRKTGGNTGMCAGKAAVSVAAAPEAPPPKASPAASSESSSSSASAVASAKVGAAAQIQAAA